MLSAASRRTPSILALSLAALAVAGCGSSLPPTSIDVTVNVDAALGLSSITVTATAPGRSRVAQTLQVPPAHGASRVAVRWQLLIPNITKGFEASLVAEGKPSAGTVTDAVQVGVVPGARVAATMSLTASCVGVSCPAGQTCANHDCRTIPVVGGSAPDAGADGASDGPLSDAADAGGGEDGAPEAGGGDDGSAPETAEEGGVGDGPMIGETADASDGSAPEAGVEAGGCPGGCTGVCQACVGNVCAPVKNADDPDSCAGTCDATGACKGKQGQACPAGGCNAGLTCVEGVCCNAACGMCKSCLTANTGQPTGTCAPVTSGLAHGLDCAATAASTCGMTGKCNGAGACALWPANTVCFGATCPAGATSATAASLCNGSGTCVAGGSSSCGAYQCNAGAAMCKSGACTSTSSDCSSGNYCNGTCVAKKVVQQICSASGECASGTCGVVTDTNICAPGPVCAGTGGRCCDVGATCVCPQPTAAELLKNPGFDSNLTSWTISPQFSNVVRSTRDVNGCPYSGSVTITSGTDSTTNPSISQCVAISNAVTYDFGAAIADGDTTTGTLLCYSAQCDLRWWSGSGCTGNDVSPASPPEVTWHNYDWLQTAYSNTGPLTPPVDAVSASVTCYTGTPVAGLTCQATFDQIYLTPSPGIY
jgi:hypothetical protein